MSIFKEIIWTIEDYMFAFKYRFFKKKVKVNLERTLSEILRDIGW